MPLGQLQRLVARSLALLRNYGEPLLVRLQPEETGPFVESLRAVPKSGLHNPLKNPERCAQLAASRPRGWQP